jgi:superfamily II DNA or RNA helicase
MSVKKIRTIYAYSHYSHYDYRKLHGDTPYIKVGDTVRDVSVRVSEQDKTENPEKPFILHSWEIPYQYRDYDVHRELDKLKVLRKRKNREWFKCDFDMVKKAINNLLHGVARPDNYKPRLEQKLFIEKAFAYFTNGGTNFLLNAIMRYGKTFATYLLMKKMQCKKVLILTYKPSVVREWNNVLNNHVEFIDYDFYYALDYDRNNPIKMKEDKNCVLFASFQDILGKDLNGNMKSKWNYVFSLDYDMIIIDETHFGANTAKAIDLINKLSYKYRLDLSGTPSKALMSGDYNDENSYNWSYIDEQKRRKKEEASGWKTEVYKWLPPLTMLTYDFGFNVVKDVQYYEEEEKSTMNKYFASHDGITFINDAAVDRFLDWLVTVDARIANTPFNANFVKKHLNHMFWYLESVNSVKAFRKKLESHYYFKQYKVIVAAGDNDGDGRDTLGLVKEAILRNEKTITLSCGKLNTGVTVPEWTAIFMLCDTQSAEDYWQTIFRIKSPNPSGNKLSCFAIDFNPNRSLQMIYDYCEHIAKSDATTPKTIREFLETMKVFSYEDNKLIVQDESFIERVINCGINPEKAIRKFESKQMASISKVDDEILEILKNIPPEKGTKLSIEVVKSKLGKGKTFKKGEKKKKKDKVDLKTTNKIIAKLLNVIQRIPTFMFISTETEEDLKHLLKTKEVDLFEQSVGISLEDFKYLLDTGFLNKKLLDRAIQSYYLATREVV